MTDLSRSDIPRRVGELAEEQARLLLDAVGAPRPGDYLLSPKEAAAQLGVSERWFADRWEDFDTVRLSNGAYRIPQSAVTRYIRTRKVG